MKNNVLIVLVSILVMGSDCESRRLEGLNNGLMEMEDGTELCPAILPWEVVGLEFDHPEAFEDAINDANEWFFPTVVFEGSIDPDRWNELEFASDDGRFGTILVSVGYVGSPRWTDGLDFEDDGGIADLRWSENGEILFVDVVVNIDYAYDYQTTRDIILHELGHGLGFAHDRNSLDLGSCMSSPPAFNCEIVDSDVDYFQDTCVQEE